MADQLGAGFGEHPERIQDQLNQFAIDPDIPTNAEREQATTEVKEKFMARLFLSNCDKRHYDCLLWDIENDYTRGNDTYPNNLTATYDYLVNYVARHHPDEDGISFYQDTQSRRHTEESQPPHIDESSGRGGRGRGRSAGRGGRGRGRGRGRGGAREGRHVAFEEDARDERVHNQEIGEAPNNQADNAQYLLDNLDQDGDY